jgi:hypothetical protein
VTHLGMLRWINERFMHDAVLEREEIWLQMDRQSHVHLFLCGPSDEVRGAFEFKNQYSGVELVQERRDFLAGMPCTDILQAKDYIYQTISLPELVRLCLKMELPKL